MCGFGRFICQSTGPLSWECSIVFLTDNNGRVSFWTCDGRNCRPFARRPDHRILATRAVGVTHRLAMEPRKPVIGGLSSLTHTIPASVHGPAAKAGGKRSR